MFKIPESIVLETVTPELAKRYLESNTKNYRPLNQRLVKKYAKDMKDGHWIDKHPQGVAFTWDGLLGDGQHRLAAVVESGASVVMWVYRGCDPAAVLESDHGQRRSEADRLRAAGFRKDVNPGKAASVARYMLTGTRGGPPTEDVRLFAMARQHLIGSFLLELARARPRRSEVVAAFCNATREFPETAVLDIARRYASCEFHGPNDPLRLLHDRLIARISQGAVRDARIYGLAVTAIRAAIAGRELMRLQAATTDFKRIALAATRRSAS